MSRQDKATTERNARTLRELVKQPDNKMCADCRKNDARWASWNLGVFVCIRCSGIHRSLGTHISKVKSIDLDIWTPEQMESVQKWGNRRANLYWERHLKAGHIPPDHKIESFIRSKYESKRWAMDGPPPSDPSTLEDGSRQSHTHEGSNGRADPTPTSTSTTSAPAPAPASRTHPLLSRNMAPKPTKTAAPTPPIVDLIGDDGPSTAPPTAPAPVHAPVSTNPDVSSPPTQTAPAGAGIFDLDFRAPVAKPQTAKADIMSLFSSNSPTASFPSAPQAQNPYASWGGGGTSTNTTMQNPTQTALPTNPNSSGGGGWGGFQQMDQGVWGAQAAPPQPQQSPQQTPNHNLWGQPAPAQNTNASGNMWGAADPWAATAASPPVQKQQENDPFANIWK